LNAVKLVCLTVNSCLSSVTFPQFNLKSSGAVVRQNNSLPIDTRNVAVKIVARQTEMMK